MIAEHLKKARSALSDFERVVGGDGTDVQLGETVTTLTVSYNEVPSHSLLKITQDSMEEMSMLFGSSLRVEIVVEQLSIYSFSGAFESIHFSSFQTDAAKCVKATITLSVNKSDLCTNLGITSDRSRIVLFLFQKSLVNLLNHSLTTLGDLEVKLWNSTISQKVVILLAEGDLRLDGDFLTVLCGPRIEDFDQLALLPDESVLDVKRYSALRQQTVRWDHPYLTLIAPPCLRLSGSYPEDDELAKLFMANWINISILYLADRVQTIDHKIVATFATERHRSQVMLFDSSNLDVFPYQDNIEALGTIADWAYESKWSGDRLRMVQVSVAKALAHGKQPRSAAALVVRSKGLLQELDWFWKSFIAEEIDKYTEAERQLEAEVAEVVEGFDGQVAEIIKSLSGTMLAAVGVLIGAVIAAVLKGNFDTRIFMLCMWVYVFYLVLFPGFYNLIHHVVRFRAMDRIFNNRRRRFESLLTPDLVSHIVDSHVTSARRRFTGWFIFTVIALATAVGGCICANKIIPPIFSERQTPTPQAAPEASILNRPSR